MKFRVPLILTSLLLVAVLMMGPDHLVFSAPPAAGSPSITITGASQPEGGVEVQYTINYSGVTQTGGVQLVISDTTFTANGFTLTSVVPAVNPTNTTTLRWRFEDLDASGDGTITITGTFNDPNTCDATVTFNASILESHQDPNSDVATDEYTATVKCNVTGPAGCEAPDVWSVGSGDWNGGGQWNTGQVPDENDIVWVRPGNQLRLFGLDTLQVQSLCNQGTLFSYHGHSLIIEASDSVTNYPGGILRGEDGEPTTGAQGSTVMIQSPVSDPNGVRIVNRGQILAGDGATGEDFGGGGGSIALLGNYVENSFKGTLTAGRGGSLTGADSAVAGHGGSITIWSSAAVKTRNRITAGNGGNGNPGASAAQDGGDAGCVWITGHTMVDVRWSIIRAGRPGNPVAGGFRGERCGVFIDPPEEIDVSGADIEGDVVELYGSDTEINVSGGITTTTVISASQGITIAVGTNGTINLSNNDNLEINVTGEGGEVVVASDTELILDDGDTLDDVVDQGTPVDAASLVLRNVAVVAPEVTGADIGVPVTMTLAIQNNGPDVDEYNVTFDAKYDWPREVTGLTSPVSVNGLAQHQFQMTVTPTDINGPIATELITITATSTDGEIIGQEITEIHVKQEPAPTAISLMNTEVTSIYNWLWLLPAMLLLLMAGLIASWRLVATRVK